MNLESGVAEKEFDADKRTFLLKFYAAYDAKGGVHHASNLTPEWMEDMSLSLKNVPKFSLNFVTKYHKKEAEK